MVCCASFARLSPDAVVAQPSRNWSPMPTGIATTVAWYAPPRTLHLILNAFLSRKKLQAMDNSHIALVSLELNRETFTNYRCDRNMSLGMNLGSLTKILKCAGANDEVKITASDDSDVLGLDFQNRRKASRDISFKSLYFCVSEADRMGQYEMKLMDIDQGSCL
jgi:hypothetical protein